MIVGRLDFGDPDEEGLEVTMRLRLTPAEATEFREIVARGMRDNTPIDVEVCAFLLARSETPQ